MYTIKPRHIVKKHVKKLQAAKLKNTYDKIIEELKTDPLVRTHGFEILEKRTPAPNLYSKRISKSNRIVYSVDQTKNEVVIFSAWRHYASGNQSLIHHKL